MKHVSIILTAIVVFFHAVTAFSSVQTSLILIGGGSRPTDALKSFVTAAQGKSIFVLPWGTAHPVESFENIKRELISVGAPDVRGACNSILSTDQQAQLKEDLSAAGGIYFPGGNQNVLFENLGNQKLVDFIRNLYQQGTAVAGTSAGTAIQSNPMLDGNGSNTRPGLGLLPGFLVDQHFLVRNREGRLIEALVTINDPKLVGLGVDEGMSVVATDGKHFKAYGPTKVIFYKLKPGMNPGEKNAYEKIELSDGQEIQF